MRASEKPASAALSVVDKGAVFGGGEKLVEKGVRERRQFFVQLLQFSLVGFREVGARVHELVVVVLQQTQRLGIKLERVALLVDARQHARRVSC